MEKKRCGNSDLYLSVLGTGCWAFGGGNYWGAQDQKDVNATVRRSVELGINFFDTAEAYNDGRSEESLGIALRGISRQNIIIASKISPNNTYPDILFAHCEASLKRLQTDYIDIYMIHWPIHPHSIRHFTDDRRVIENPPRLADALEAIAQLQVQGKIRYLGVSNFGLERLHEVKRLAPSIIVNELPYSLLTRAIEAEVIPYCQKSAIGIIGYMTLLQGILSGTYAKLSELPPNQRRTRHFDSRTNPLCRHGGNGVEGETEETLEEIRSLIRESGRPMYEIAIQWAIQQRAMTSVLVGARNEGELQANVAAASERMPAELYEKLNVVTMPLLVKMGNGFDYYESVENDRT